MHEREQVDTQSIARRDRPSVVRHAHALARPICTPASHCFVSTLSMVGKICLDESVAGGRSRCYLFHSRSGARDRCNAQEKKVRSKLVERLNVLHLTKRWSEPLTGAKIYFR